uniref:Uncharacterized protein n=1 Tax=Arundo donax TaxID=35708 RepID=A0A0A9G164_ARUDO
MAITQLSHYRFARNEILQVRVAGQEPICPPLWMPNFVRRSARPIPPGICNVPVRFNHRLPTNVKLGTMLPCR